MKVILYTSSGHLVAETSIPPFVSPPEVLLWGNRVFLLPLASRDSQSDTLSYYEVFFYVLGSLGHRTISDIITHE